MSAVSRTVTPNVHACMQFYTSFAHQLTQIDTPHFRYEILHELFTGTVIPTCTTALVQNGALALAIKHNSITILTVWNCKAYSPTMFMKME